MEQWGEHRGLISFCQFVNSDHCTSTGVTDLWSHVANWPLKHSATHDVIKTFSESLACVLGIRQWPVNSPHKGQWSGALMFSLICAWINGWVNNHQADDSRRHRAHYDATVMKYLPYRNAGYITNSLLFRHEIYRCVIYIIEFHNQCLNYIALYGEDIRTLAAK